MDVIKNLTKQILKTDLQLLISKSASLHCSDFEDYCSTKEVRRKEVERTKTLL